MMHDVNSPQHRERVMQPMHPVEPKVPREDRKEPHGSGMPAIEPVQAEVRENPRKHGDFDAPEEPHQDMPGVQIQDHVAPRNGHTALCMRVPQLHQHAGQRDEERNGHCIHDSLSRGLSNAALALAWVDVTAMDDPRRRRTYATRQPLAQPSKTPAPRSIAR